MDVASLALMAFGYLAALAFVLTGAIDAARFSRPTWVDAGLRRGYWMWQAAGVLVPPLGLVYSGTYFVRIRPRLAAARRALTELDPDYQAWVAHRRWYDRLVPARRSPEGWAKAARQWWIWGLHAVVAAVVAAAWLYLYDERPAHESPRTMLEVDAIVWAVLALASAVRAGFWYGEHMRLTGRRPAAGGRLLPPEDDPRGR